MSSDELLEDFLIITLKQGGRQEYIELNEHNIKEKFRALLDKIFKKYKMKEKFVMLTTDDGRMVPPFKYNQPIETIVKDFGNKLNLYYEKQI